MRIRSRWELSILVIAAMLTLAAITPQPALADSRGHFDKTLTVTGAVDLDVQTGSGDITVIPEIRITSKSTPRFAPATRSSAVMSMRASSRSKTTRRSCRKATPSASVIATIAIYSKIFRSAMTSKLPSKLSFARNRAQAMKPSMESPDRWKPRAGQAQ